MKIEQEKTTSDPNSDIKIQINSFGSSDPRNLIKRYGFTKKKLIIFIGVSHLIVVSALAIIFFYLFIKVDKSLIVHPSNSFELDENCIQIGYQKQVQCSSIFAYEPKFLTYETSIFSSNIIKQVVLCNNAQVELRCPIGKSIKLLSAYYGLQTSSTKTECTNFPSNFSLTCYNIDTYEKLENLCNQKQTCSILATTRVFGDPCPSSEKQMLIQYQCINNNLTSSCSINKALNPICPFNNKTSVIQKTWCEPSNMIIECPNDRFIKIICGFYGIDPNYQCEGTFRSGSEPSYCYSQNSTKKIMNSCNGKQKCVLRGDPNFVIGSNFENICAGYAKVLLVQWECQVSQGDEVTEKLLIEENRKEFCTTDQTIECELDSPNYPSNKSTIRPFNYPIYEQIACQNSRVILSCPEELRIFIYSAYYGIQSPTISQTCVSSKLESQEVSIDCYSMDSLDKIKNLCENKTSCLINANSKFFNDPCPTLPKQLYVQYQCINTFDFDLIVSKCKNVSFEKESLTFPCTLSNDTLKKHSILNSQSTQITCDVDTKIKSICAFYGVHPILNNTYSYEVCYSTNTINVLKNLCDEKSTCIIEKIDEKFSNDCMNKNKTLFYQYECS